MARPVVVWCLAVWSSVSAAVPSVQADWAISNGPALGALAMNRAGKHSPTADRMAA